MVIVVLLLAVGMPRTAVVRVTARLAAELLGTVTITWGT